MRLSPSIHKGQIIRGFARKTTHHEAVDPTPDYERAPLTVETIRNHVHDVESTCLLKQLPLPSGGGDLRVNGARTSSRRCPLSLEPPEGCPCRRPSRVATLPRRAALFLSLWVSTLSSTPGCDQRTAFSLPKLSVNRRLVVETDDLVRCT
jgi:hypothetical protein